MNTEFSSEAPRGIRDAPTTAWLAQHVAGLVPPLSWRVIVGGHSNLTYALRDAAGARYVVRRPPLGAVLATAHDMGREHKILTGVGKTAVPVPPVLALCADPAVNDAPFYVMRFVDGHVLDTADAAARGVPDPAARRRLGFATAEVLAALHQVDPDQVGLGDLGKKEDYLGRQLKRWRTQWDNSKTRELLAMEEAHALLLAAKPSQSYTGIVHGDYRLGNMLSREDGTIAAVLDWELCTLGDVLADVGYVLNNWLEAGERTAATIELPPTTAPGFPTRAEWLARYRELTGHQIAGIEYYRAFQHWRLAAIAEGVLARYLKGVMATSEFDADRYRLRVEAMASEALNLLRAL